MALLKAFVCQLFLFGMYKLILEQVVEKHFVPDELTRNCIFGFICLLCFGIQLYTDKTEEENSQAETTRTKSRRRTPPDTAESVSEFLNARQMHMMRTLDAAMANMGQMPMSEAGYGQNVIFAHAGPEATTFVAEPDVIVFEEIHVTKLGEAMFSNERNGPTCDHDVNEAIVKPCTVEEVEDDESEEEVEEEVEDEQIVENEEEEIETKSDVCEEDEDVVTVIDTSKQNETVKVVQNTKTESEEEEEEEEESEEEEDTETPVVDNKKQGKKEEKPEKELSKPEVEEEEEEEEESGDEQEDAKKVIKKS